MIFSRHMLRRDWSCSADWRTRLSAHTKLMTRIVGKVDGQRSPDAHKNSLAKMWSWFCLMLLGLTAWGAHAEEPQEFPDPSHKHFDYEEIIVTASPFPRLRFDVLQSTSTLSGDKLEEVLAGNLGETLDHVPGLAQSYFGPGAGRPLVRGLGGDRIRILVSGIGSFDASSTSPDHAPAADALSVKSVEIVRGPATLLYGNNAVGGVINVRDGRIPTEVPQNRLDVLGRALHAGNGDDNSLAVSLDTRVGGHWVLHTDGSLRSTNDILVPGFLRSARLRENDPLPPGNEESFRRAQNTSLQSQDFSSGLSRLFTQGFVGISLSHNASDYGIPLVTGYGEEQAVRIDLEQTRFDFMSEIQHPFLIFEEAKIRFGYGDYEHREITEETDGTRFFNTEWEGRVELVQKSGNRLSGAMGVQLRHRDFKVTGAEAFVPPSLTSQHGVFVLQEYKTGPVRIEGGVRIERQTVSAPTLSLQRSFTGASLSGGVSYFLDDGIVLGVIAYRTERAPNAEELFSYGPHLATNAFEIGDATLAEEVAKGFEVAIRKAKGRLRGSANFFLTHYSNFIFEQPDGSQIDELPLYRFTSRDVAFHGAEVELLFEAVQQERFQLAFDVMLDFVRAQERSTSTPLPRIPPFGLQLGAEVTSAAVDFRVEMEHAAKQGRIALNELPTDSYSAFNASLTVRPWASSQEVTVRIQARNLTNEEIRYHTSFLKDILPAPGRSVRVSLQAGF